MAGTGFPSGTLGAGEESRGQATTTATMTTPAVARATLLQRILPQALMSGIGGGCR